MTFLQPWWFLLAGLIVPLVLWQGRRAREITVPSLYLWRRLPPSSEQVRSPSWRPRATISLLLLVAALLSLILGLAGPRPTGFAVDHHVLVVDRSASMGVAWGQGTRLSALLETARHELASLDPLARGGPRVSIVAVGPTVDVLAARHASAARSLDGIDEIRASTSPDVASWREVAERVNALVDPSERVRVVVLTDGQGQEAARTALRAGTRRLDVRAVGESAPTLGFSAVRAVSVDPEEGSWRIEGEIVAHPPQADVEPVLLRAEFERDGLEGSLPWRELEVRMDGDRTRFSFETTVPGSGVLTLRLPSDAFPHDDRAHLLLRDAPLPIRILVWGEIPDRLRHAIEALEAAEVFDVASDAQPAPIRRVDLAVVATREAPIGRMDEALDARVVLWTNGASPSGVAPERTMPPAQLALGTTTLGLTRVEDVPDGAIDVAYAVAPLPGADVLLASDLGPMLQVAVQGRRADVVAAWNLGSTVWTRELGFARFVAELAALAEPRHGRWSGDRCIAGRHCDAAPAGVAPETLGVRDDGGGRWIVDGEAGPESDLSASVVETPAETTARTWRALDRLLLLLAAVLLAAEGTATWWRRRRAAATTAARPRRLRARYARVFAVALLCAAAAGIPVPRPQGPRPPMLVLEPLAWRLADAATTSLDPEDALRSVDTAILASGHGRLREAAREPQLADLGYDAVEVLRLAAARRDVRDRRVVLAGLAVPPGSEVDLLAESFERQGVRVDVVPAPSPTEDEAWVAGIGAPSTVTAGNPMTITPVGGGPGRDQRRIAVQVDGETVGRVSPDGAGSVRFTPQRAGPHEVVARIGDEESTGSPVNDRRTAWVDVRPAGRVAIVSTEDDASQVTAIASLLGDAGFEVETWTPRAFPVAAEGLLGVDVVLLLDVPAISLHQRQQVALETWVSQHGGGVLVAGATRAFGPGGYLRTPLEDLSPLSARVPGEQPRAAVAFVIDRSGSMQQTAGGISRLEVAKEASLAAVDLLHPASQVSIVVFDDVATTLVPLGPPQDLRSRLAPVTPGGGTNLYPALESAYQELQASDAEARHMIVLTDGLAQTAPFDDLVRTIAQSGITISTVAIGRGADTTLLASIAMGAAGAFHESSDVRALPSILSQEAMLLSGSPVREQSVVPRMQEADSAFLEELAGGFGPVGGYVRTTPRPEADIHAVVAGGDPLLGSWRHGVGRVVALATPLTGPWTDPWMADDFGPELLEHTVRWLRTPTAPPGLSLAVERRDDALHVRADLIGTMGEGIEGAWLDATLVDPSGEPRRAAALADLGAGRYGRRFDVFETGRYRVRVEPVDTRSRALAEPDERLVEVSFPAAYAPSATAISGAAALARATGGSIILDGDPLRPSGTWRLVGEPLAGPWALLALASAIIGLVLARARRSGQVRPPS